MNATSALEQLARHREFLGDEAAQVIDTTVRDVRRRLARQELAVAVVGEKKAGKSTFLNAILGARVLGAATRECTGAVTFIRKAPSPSYRATLSNGSVIEFVDREANERLRLEGEEASLLEIVGRTPPPLNRGMKDLEASERAAAREFEKEALKRSQAEASARQRERERDVARAELDRATEERNAALASHTSIDGRLRDIRASLNAASKALESAHDALSAHAREHPLALPADVDAVSVLQAASDLRDADLERARAEASIPFFMRPHPWWAIWALALRVLLGWWFRARVRARDEAEMRHRRAALVLAVAEASQHVTILRHEGIDAASQAQSMATTLTHATDRLRAADERCASVSQAARLAAATFATARRDEALARLKQLRLKLELLRVAQQARFETEVHALTDMNKRGRDVVELAIGFPARHLPRGVVILDTPGVNTDDELNRERAWNAIRQEADGCILVSDLQQAVSESTSEFLQELRAIIPHILLVMTKVDRALANADDVGDMPAWEQVQDARRVAVRRFAKEVGRSPKEVFSIAVAAEPALRGDTSRDGLGAHFGPEVTKIFDLLQSERVVVLAARAAVAIRYCVQQIGAAQARAEARYAKRIEELERHRLPDPQAFQAHELAKIEEPLRAEAAGIVAHAIEVMKAHVDQVQNQWISEIRACSDKEQVKATTARLGEHLPVAIRWVMQQVDGAVAAEAHRAIRELEQPLHAGLRERYRIVQQIAGSGRTIQLDSEGALSSVAANVELHTGMSDAVASFESTQFMVGAGGALAGAAVGTFILPGIGTLIGGALGAFAGAFVTLDSLKAKCVEQVVANLGKAKSQLEAQLKATDGPIGDAMRGTLTQSLADAVSRFQAWIHQLMAAEQRRIDAERQKLANLMAIRQALMTHDQTLDALQKEAAAVSRGLCA